MRRSFNIADLVQLPRLDTPSAQSLGTAVLAAAGHVNDLPPLVEEAVSDLATRLGALNMVVVHNLPATAIADTRRAKAADVMLDGAWSGIQSWATGWTRMTGLPEADSARAILEVLFPDGLKFTQLAYKLEWAESNTRILSIEERGLTPHFEQLGGQKLVARIRALHAEYGEALNITDVPDPSPATIGDALAAFTAALRTYVVRAVSLISERDEKSTAMARALLAPIELWETPGGKSGGNEEDLDDEDDEEPEGLAQPAPVVPPAPVVQPAPAPQPNGTATSPPTPAVNPS